MSDFCPTKRIVDMTEQEKQLKQFQKEIQLLHSPRKVKKALVNAYVLIGSLITFTVMTFLSQSIFF